MSTAVHYPANPHFERFVRLASREASREHAVARRCLGRIRHRWVGGRPWAELRPDVPSKGTVWRLPEQRSTTSASTSSPRGRACGSHWEARAAPGSRRCPARRSPCLHTTLPPHGNCTTKLRRRAQGTRRVRGDVGTVRLGRGGGGGGGGGSRRATSCSRCSWPTRSASDQVTRPRRHAHARPRRKRELRKRGEREVSPAANAVHLVGADQALQQDGVEYDAGAAADDARDGRVPVRVRRWTSSTTRGGAAPQDADPGRRREPRVRARRERRTRARPQQGPGQHGGQRRARRRSRQCG